MRRLDEMVRLAKSGGSAPRFEWYRALRELTAKNRRAGESEPQAFLRVCREYPEGRQLYARYRQAEGPSFQPAAEKRTPNLAEQSAA